MATPSTLTTEEELVRYELDPADPLVPQRYLYFAPECFDWYDEVLYEAPAEFGKKLTPYQIAADFLRGFVIGRRLFHSSDVVNVMPQRDGIWEMKPDGARFFGWVWKKGMFIAARGELKSLLMAERYEILIDETIEFRRQLDLDPPKFILGSNHDLF